MDPELPLPEVSSQPPEQIPMPAPAPVNDGDAPPASFTRELDPSEKSNVLIQFMGSQYGELNKLDGQIEGHGSLGKGSSAKVKQQVAQVLESVHAPPTPVGPAPVVPQQQQVTVPAAAHVPEHQPVQEPPTVDTNQLEFDFDVDEKRELLSMVRSLVDSVRAQREEISLLTDKIDNLTKMSKKKSPGRPRKAVDTTSEV